MEKDTLGPDEFRCAGCGGIFPKGWTDREADAEYERNFGMAPTPEDDEILCDDCYALFLKQTFN